MRKENITWRAYRRYCGYNKKYFPLKFLHIFLQNISPYFNLWMSAEIVTALSDGKSKENLFELVTVTLLGNLFIHILGAVLGRSVDIALQILRHNESAALNRKTVSLDYAKLEDPDTRTLRRKIKENAYINNYGVTAMQNGLEELFRCFTSMLLAVILFAEMAADMVRAGFEPLSVFLLIGLIGFTAVSIGYNHFTQKKSSERNRKIGEWMLKENQLGRGHGLNGMDARIYKQQDIVTRFDTRMNREHLRLFSWARRQAWILTTPYILLSKIPEICVYLIVCFYCTKGIFPVGGVIKYVGYLNRVTADLLAFFNTLSDLKNNEPFLIPYMEYFDIRNDMYQGLLAVEKRSDKKFDIEFCDVSFRYAGAEEYALKHISLSLKAGERLAVVGG